MLKQLPQSEDLQNAIQERLDTVSLEDRSYWYTSPVTEILRAYLVAYEQGLREKWAEGGFTGSSIDETIQLNSKALGMLEAVGYIADTIEIYGGKI